MDELRLFNLGTANNGNVASIANNRNTNRTQKFSYDELNRIKTAQSAATSGTDCWGLQFGYDIWANLLTISQKPTHNCSSTTLSVGVNTKNQISDAGFVYDAAGNLTNTPNPGGLTMVYDAENRLITSVSTLGNAVYVYDANGRRVQRTVNGVTTDFIYDQGASVIAEKQGSTWKKAYVYAGGQMLAQYDNTVTPNTTYFAHKDHLGSTRLLTKVNQTTQECDGYQPFGELDTSVCTPQVGTAATTHKFTGKERDMESGLDNFGARYMSSAMGRFVSADNPKFSEKSDPRTWNLYSYVSNNPLSRIDLTGNNWFKMNGTWSWYQGSDVTADGKACKRGTEGCIHSDTTHILVIEKTGHLNDQGAEIVNITLWGNSDPTKTGPIEKGTGFSGGTDQASAAPNGDYEINLNNRGGVGTNRIVVNARGQLLLGSFRDGIQVVSDYIPYRGDRYSATDAWGTLRANLSRGPGRGTPFYLHGQGSGLGTTAGCVAEPAQKVLRVIFALDPSGVGEGDKNGRIAVSLQGPK